MMKHPLTDVGLERFISDWKKGQEALKKIKAEKKAQPARV
jgi:hypothetical protein